MDISQKQKLFFKMLKDTKDYWVDTAIEALSPEDTYIKLTEVEAEWRLLQRKIQSEEEKAAFRKVLNKIIVGVMHSVLVAFDGGDELNDHFLPEIIDHETGESLHENIALHEEFIGYLIDVEEDKQ